MQVTGLPELLLNKSAAVRGFFVTSHAKHFKSHFSRLLSQWESGRLKITLDSKQFRCVPLPGCWAPGWSATCTLPCTIWLRV